MIAQNQSALSPRAFFRTAQSSTILQKLSMITIFALFLGCGVVTSTLTNAQTAASTPTVVLNDASILRSNTKRAGINLGSVNYYDSGQLLKNLIGALNPGFEPPISQQIWVLTAAGTTTSFSDPDPYDTVPANYWAGGTFTVIASQSGGAELGCTGTIASNTGPNYPNENNTSPVFTVAKACPAAFNVGDMVVFSLMPSSTPESWWENSQGGFWASISGGGKLLSDTTDLCSTCGKQALQLNATATGSSTRVSAYYDSASTQNLFVLMNGTYQLSFWAKAAAGSPTLTVGASRPSTGGFSCGSYTPALTSTWTQYTYNCTAAETQSATVPGTAQVNFSVNGGAVDLDNISFAKTGGSSSNATVFRDEVISALQSYYSLSSGGNPGVLRNWLGQNGETMENWSQPGYAHSPTVGGAGYFVGPSGIGSEQLSLEDYLVICQLLHAEPYLEVPVTFTTQDAAGLIEFLAGPTSTKYGARRAALGQANPWTSVFSQIHLAYCNECWNGGTFPGQSLAWRSSQPANEYLHDYSVRAKAVFVAMRGDAYYSQPAFDLVMNAQTGVNWSMDTEIAEAHPDSIELQSYTYATVNDFSTDAALWGPAMIEPYDKATDPSDPSNFYQSVQDYHGQKSCGASGAAACNVNVYEWGQGTLAGNIDQTHMDYINAGAGEGPIAVLESMLNLQNFGIVNSAYFALAEFNNGGLNGRTVKLWGNTVDMGGATNNKRPQFLALSLMNQSVIGPMYSCPISTNATYSFAGNASNGTNIPPGIPQLNNVPYLYAFCFENGTKRSLVLVNADLTGSHTLAFSGTNVPAGVVTERAYAPAGLNDMNEAPTGQASNKAKATVVLTSTTLANPASITLPPHSVIALDYTAGSSTPVAQTSMPSISPASGSYSSTVSVNITDATQGATIYYTTDGSTPTTSSSMYTGPISLSSSATVHAMALASGYTSSATASATYTVSIVSGTAATPTFSPAGGSYNSAQKVTINDATSGAKIYYTADGSTPSTSSAAYTGPVTVSTSATMKAMAVASGKTNSSVASASYVIATSGSSSSFPSYPTGMSSIGMALNGSAAISNNTLELTDNGYNQIASAWYATKVPINKFTSDFTFQLLSPDADGFTFTIQNSAAGIKALGQNGGGLGFAGITSSVALKFDLYNNGGEGSDSTGLYLGGVVPGNPATDLSSSGVNLHSGHVFRAHLVYDGSILTLALTDTSTGAAFEKQFAVNISNAVGSTTAYIGFTASTGGHTSTQIIQNWTYSNSVIASTAATPVISPAGGSYARAQTISISDTTTGAKIYYTTDGSIPTSSSKLYTGSLLVSASETLQAVAVAAGYSNSIVASAKYTIGSAVSLPSYSSGMTATAMSVNGSAKMTNGVLKLTDGGQSEAGSAWYMTKVPVNAFVSDFTFQAINAAADGFAFVIQNNGSTTKALGGNGGNLGYAGINNSVAVKFDLYSNAGEGPDSTGVYLNGVNPSLPFADLSSSTINLHSGDVFQAHVVYSGTTLTLTLTDTKTKNAVTEKFAVNIPAAVGDTTAYVGFTGSTGGGTATQDILAWSYAQ
jgi:hypothetical protein